jgi:hypothetical protein
MTLRILGRCGSLMPVCAWCRKCQRDITISIKGRPAKVTIINMLCYATLISNPPLNARRNATNLPQPIMTSLFCERKQQIMVFKHPPSDLMRRECISARCFYA